VVPDIRQTLVAVSCVLGDMGGEGTQTHAMQTLVPGYECMTRGLLGRYSSSEAWH
jgi:hypothetical protein